MTPPQPPPNRPVNSPDDGKAQWTSNSSDPATDPTAVVPPNQQHSDYGQYAFGVQPPPPGVPPQPGWQTPTAYEPQAAPGYWPQLGPGYGQQAFPGYGAPPGYGQPPRGPGDYRQFGGGPSNGQVTLWITLGVVGFLGLLGAILTLTLLMDVSTAVSRASDICDQYGGQISEICKQSLRNHGVKVPMAAVTYLVLIIVASLAAVGGAVLMLLKKHFGQILVLGGGVVMTLFAIICAAQYGGTGRITYDLIAGIVIAAVAGLLFLPQVRLFLELPPASGRRPDQYPYPYGQPYPGQYGHYGQPGPGGYPSRPW